MINDDERCYRYGAVFGRHGPKVPGRDGYWSPSPGRKR